MDGRAFDQFSRGFGKLTTRRQALKAVAGAVVGLVAGSRVAAAQTCTPHYSPCGSDGDCCAGAMCEYGLCMPGCRVNGAFAHPWTSPPENICGQCQPEVSTTSLVPVNDGMACWSGDPNAGFTTCQSGVCRGTGPVDCRPQSACHTAAINPQTGQCEQGVAPAGTPCGNGPMCYGGFHTPADACDGNGFCIGGGSQTVNCAPYQCVGNACGSTCASDRECTNDAVCCGGACVRLGTIDHCSGCGDVCTAVDACTPAECDDGTCNTTSVCTPVDACTPARCADGACNTVTDCPSDTDCNPETAICELRGSCLNNPQWTPVTCTTTQWVWSSNSSVAKDLQSANTAQVLQTGCQHGVGVDSMCSLDGTGWVSTATFTMSGCNSSWWHIGGIYSGQCGGHDGDTYRHLVLGPADCYPY